MSAYRDLAYLLEKSAPQDLAQLRAAHPGAGALFSSAKMLGAGERDVPHDPAAERDFARRGLAALKVGADALVKRLAGRIGRARGFRLGGALIAMTSSAGLAAATLDFIAIDHKLASLTLSGIGFIGAAIAAFSEDLTRGAGAGADPASILGRLAALNGDIERARSRIDTAEVSKAAGDVYAGILATLNECAATLAQLKTLAAAA